MKIDRRISLDGCSLGIVSVHVYLQNLLCVLISCDKVFYKRLHRSFVRVVLELRMNQIVTFFRPDSKRDVQLRVTVFYDVGFQKVKIESDF
jgi:hypothetical protein